MTKQGGTVVQLIAKLPSLLPDLTLSFSVHRSIHLYVFFFLQNSGLGLYPWCLSVPGLVSGSIVTITMVKRMNETMKRMVFYCLVCD